MGKTSGAEGKASPNISLSAAIIMEGTRYNIGALVDSGCQFSLIDSSTVEKFRIRTIQLAEPVRVCSLDGRELSTISRVTEPVQLLVSGNHREVIEFYVFKDMRHAVVLGKDWLNKHDPNISFRSGEIRSWGKDCLSNCLRAASFSETNVGKTKCSVDLSKVPDVYHDLAEVFDKDLAVVLPPHRPYDCGINLLPDAKLPTGRMYNISLPERESLEKYISEGLATGIIRPSTSPLAAGFFFVKKKDGSLRPCIDYRQLNDITVKDKYPLPLISSTFQPLAGSTIFSKLDLRNAYHLVRIKEGDEWKTAFNTPVGHFEYLVVPFGLTNAPAVFQRLVNDVLRDMINNFVVVYLDDILIFSRNREEHIEHVRRVLTRLLENRLFVKAEKCEFHTQSVEFLGHVIKRGQVETDPRKIEAVRDWAVPSSRNQLQRFLGFANYYRRFVKNYSMIVNPLTRLTSPKEPYVWSEETERAFSEIKTALTTAPVLVHPDINKPFIVEVDASDVGIGAVLSQRVDKGGARHPCAFFSRKLSPAERNYAVGDKELLAMHAALSEWRHWLEGARHPFIVWTDHKNLQSIRSVKRVSARQARWAGFFARFSFTISYFPGSMNTVADALSRCASVSSAPKGRDVPVLPDSMIVGAVEWEVVDEVRRALKNCVAPNDAPSDKLFVPEQLRSRVLQWGHSSRLACHPGVSKTSSFIKRSFWWPGMTRDIYSFVSACPTCSRGKSSHSKPDGLLQPLPVPDRPWACIAIDFISGLPTSHNKTVILTIVDRFSKQVHLVPLSKLPSAMVTARLLIQHVVRLHGLPKEILSDRGPQFISAIWHTVWKELGVKAQLTSGYHPQSNGQCERANQSVESCLRCLCHERPTRWVEELPWIELAMNSMVNATGLSAFEAAIGYQPPLVPEQEPAADSPSPRGFVQRARRVWRRVKAAMVKANLTSKRFADRKRKPPPNYRVGQQVWLCSKDVNLYIKSKKLAPKFIGPFPIERVINPVTVRLKLPSHMRVNPVFHVGQVKPVATSSLVSNAPSPPPPRFVNGGPVFEVERIVDVRRRGRGHQYLVRWKGYPVEQQTWVPRSFILDPGLLGAFYRTRPNAPGAPRGRDAEGGGRTVRSRSSTGGTQAPGSSTDRTSTAGAYRSRLRSGSLIGGRPLHKGASGASSTQRPCAT